LKILYAFAYLVVLPEMVFANFAPLPIFKCSLNSHDNTPINLVLEQTKVGKLIWRQDGAKREATFIDSAFSHGSAIGAAVGWSDDTIRTLVIHRIYIRPWPKEFDANKPPATLSVQSFTKSAESVGSIYHGFCEIN
jgi:hypothetical protein